MTDLTKQMLEKLNEFFEEEKLLNHAAHVVQFDMETVCPAPSFTIICSIRMSAG